MEEILRTIIENLVDNKEEVTIEKVQEENKDIYKIKVNKEEMGKVIGKQGRIAKSIRTVMKAMASKENKKATIEFIG